MTTDNNEITIPTSTAIMARIPIFEPTIKAKYAENITHDENGVKLTKDITRVVDETERVVENVYGTATITGRLGQNHANLLESIMYNISDILACDESSMLVTVDPYKIRMSMGGGKKFSHAELDILVKELMGVVVDIKFNDFRVRGHLIDSIINDEKNIDNRLSNLIPGGNQKRSLWIVKVGVAYMQIMKHDNIKINRDPKLIANLKKGVSQAVARFCSTHSNTPNGGWILDNMIECVGAVKKDEYGKFDNITLRNRRRDIRDDKEGMVKCGIILEGDRLFLKNSNNQI